MCLITYAPKGSLSLDLEVLEYSAKTMNDDGFGLAWFDKGKWIIRKSMRPQTLERVIAMAPAKAPMVIHQRFATHGAKDLTNCHPYPIGETGAHLFHNGVIDGTGSKKKKGPSDTGCYVRDELAPIIAVTGHELLKTPGVQWSIGNRVGASVLAIIRPRDEEVILINESQGEWEKGVYYSNSYCRPGGYGNYWDKWENKKYEFPMSSGTEAANVDGRYDGYQNKWGETRTYKDIKAYESLATFEEAEDEYLDDLQGEYNEYFGVNK